MDRGVDVDVLCYAMPALTQAQLFGIVMMLSSKGRGGKRGELAEFALGEVTEDCFGAVVSVSDELQ